MKVSSLLKICLMTCALIATPKSQLPKHQYSAPVKTNKNNVQGTPAPNFKLQDQNGKWHELKQYQGKWLVLYFYPKDNSPGCTEEANQFKTLYPQFLKTNAVVLGASLDDVASHQKFSKALGLPFPILADQQHKLATQLGIVRNLGILKVAKRETFLIDPKGIIVYHYTSVNTQTHAAQVLADIKRLQQ
jgi:Peroxiredoxin